MPNYTTPAVSQLTGCVVDHQWMKVVCSFCGLHCWHLPLLLSGKSALEPGWKKRFSIWLFTLANQCRINKTTTVTSCYGERFPFKQVQNVSVYQVLALPSFWTVKVHILTERQQHMRIAIYGPVNTSTFSLIRSIFSKICPFLCRAIRCNHQSAFVGTSSAPIFAQKSSLPFGLSFRQHMTIFFLLAA